MMFDLIITEKRVICSYLEFRDVFAVITQICMLVYRQLPSVLVVCYLC